MPLPPIAGRERTAAGVTLRFGLTPALIPFDGHFPDTPILPAVAQIDWAVRLARESFPLPPRFHALRSLKFLAIVQPPVELVLELTPHGDRAVDFAYTRNGAPCATGRIEFADDAAGPDRPLL